MNTRAYWSQGKADAMRMMGVKKSHQMEFRNHEDADWGEVARSVVVGASSGAVGMGSKGYQQTRVTFWEFDRTFSVGCSATYLKSKQEFKVDVTVQGVDNPMRHSMGERVYGFKDSLEEVYEAGSEDVEEWLEDIFEEWGEEEMRSMIYEDTVNRVYTALSEEADEMGLDKVGDLDIFTLRGVDKKDIQVLVDSNRLVPNQYGYSIPPGMFGIDAFNRRFR